MAGPVAAYSASSCGRDEEKLRGRTCCDLSGASNGASETARHRERQHHGYAKQNPTGDEILPRPWADDKKSTIAILRRSSR